MPPCLHEIAEDGLFAQLLACLQTMQPFYQHETVAVLPHQDRALLADLQDTLGDLLRLLGIERRAALRRHIDLCDRECLALHHGWTRPVPPLIPPDPPPCPAPPSRTARRRRASRRGPRRRSRRCLP